jgi:hypothetical protein
MAAMIVRLHSNETEWQVLAEAGPAFIAPRCSDESVVAALKAAIEGQLATGAPPTAAV